MRKVYPLVTLLFIFVFGSLVFGREARLVRYPSYSNGRIAFTYLGDIWTAGENGQNIQRLTVNKARDAYPRFSPDGKWIAFSSGDVRFPSISADGKTGSYSLIDGATVRTPGVGVYLADPKRTNMENYGVQPDIRVDNSPEDNLAGRDRQLEAAVEELLKQLGGVKRNIASKEQQ
jgi:hypothetical protein